MKNIQSLIRVLDLKFQNCPGAIASYLIPHQDGAVLVESGPGSTRETLTAALEKEGFGLEKLTHVLLTHIHLDHAGAAGWLAARSGALVCVHPRGAPHLLDPSRLLASAGRIYGDRMDQLWGEFLPVPEKQLVILEDGARVEAGDLVFTALDTPGHANHHLVYLLGDGCFSGDVGGVRIQGETDRLVRAPMPPPEFHPPRWRESISKLEALNLRWIAPTHFGIFNDPDWQLQALREDLDAAELWMEAVMPRNLPLEELRKEFISWTRERSHQLQLDGDVIEAFEKANPSGMSADGIKRYWEKYILTD